MDNTLNRRHFLGGVVATAVAANAAHAAAGKSLPTRVLGRTGVRVSILALGCGSRLLSYEDEERAVAALNLALDLGITYLDTAQAYGQGRSETWVGKVMKHRRKGVFLATKIATRKGDEALRNTEASLKRLQTDHLDLVHIHTLRGEEDLEQIEAQDGVLQALYKLRDQKLTRFIGITSHFDPAALRLALDRHDFDCTQMALNAALQGFTSGSGKMVLNPAMKASFETVALAGGQEEKPRRDRHEGRWPGRAARRQCRRIQDGKAASVFAVPSGSGRGGRHAEAGAHSPERGTRAPFQAHAQRPDGRPFPPYVGRLQGCARPQICAASRRLILAPAEKNCFDIQARKR